MFGEKEEEIAEKINSVFRVRIYPYLKRDIGERVVDPEIKQFRQLHSSSKYSRVVVHNRDCLSVSGNSRIYHEPVLRKVLVAALGQRKMEKCGQRIRG